MSKFNETHNTSLKKNFALSTAYQILLIIAPFITAPYVSRVIGADGIGIHSFTDSILAYFTMFATLGTNSYASREMSRNRDDRAIMSKIFWEIMIVRVITTGICLVAWVFFILLTPTYKIFYLILTIPLFATIFDISWLYTGLEQFSHTVYRNAFFRILGIVLIFIFIRKKEDLIWYYIITAGIILPSNLTLWIPLHKFVDKPNFHNIHLRQHFKETMIYFVPSIATSIYTVLDKTLIGVITHSAAENGYYEQATKIINMTKAVTFSALNGIMVARMSYLYKEGEIIELKNRLSQSINYVLFSGIGCCFGIIAVAHRFVPVFFGKDYDQVIPIMQLL
ncbi:MAG: oligosaccharide flippase family protein, partial [Spirochaetales bacterium]|nr:oligosaccharide flippase family protein [Spirochaetales bacterium]